jgi:hypothetical protein
VRRAFRRAALAGTLFALLAGAAPAGAAFGGRNGAVAYEGRSSDRGVLYLREADGSGLRRLAVPGAPADPAFSPAGRRIAYSSNGQLWVIYADGTGARRITSGFRPSRDPTWSPGGDALAFAAGFKGERRIAGVLATGRDRFALTEPGSDDDHSPAWSARDEIAFVRSTEHGGGDLRVMPAAGGRPRRLTGGPADDGAPAWSPDGRRLAFTRGRGRRTQVWVINRDGTHLRRVTDAPQGVNSPAWSPDGRWIAFGMGRGGRRALYRVRTDGGGLRRVAPGASDARALDWQAVGLDPVVAAVGDMACDPGSAVYRTGEGTTGRCRQLKVSDVLLGMDLSAMLALGDLQYEDGTLPKFMAAFEPTWGRFKGLMHPVVGNHDARDPGASGYFDYFNGPGVLDGPAGRRGEGWYSFDLGGWHLVALNSQCSHPPGAATLTDCAAGSPQEQWLRADLAAHPARCTLAFWHHPLTSSGLGGFNTAVQPLWQALYDHGVDVVLTGHDHGYERFAPLDPAGGRDGARGIRQFVVGTGGKSHQPVVEPKAYSEVRDDTSFGVLRLTLRPNGYRWAFVPEELGDFTDAGANDCH